MYNYDVFLSHSSKNCDISDAVCDYLESNGIKCWIAPRDIMPGVSYPKQIVKAIRDCHTFVLLVSEYTNTSEHVSNEIELAFDGSKLIVPFMIEDIQLSDEHQYFLSRKQQVYAHKCFDTGLHQLKTSIHEHMKTLGCYTAKASTPDVTVLETTKNDSAKHSIMTAKKVKSNVNSEYTIYFTDELIETGMTHLEIEQVFEDIALKTMTGLEGQDDWIGDPQQWADIHNEHPDTTRILVFDNKIVGYYFFLFFKDEYFEEIKKGKISDDDICIDMLESADLPGAFSCYFDDIAVLQEHRRLGPIKLIDDFMERLELYAEECEIFVTEMCTVAISKNGEDMCKKLGMKRTDAETDDVIYSIKLLPFPQEGFLARRYTKLKTLYDEYYQMS
ncbi:MAG: toll/interleukin-1 receptor domain-containing protein [Oscillospiraceae bacterium]|nr:toll/interleukin-1 receptor domain-containing protein [Oscillospiraceae bacterium]